MDHILTRHFRLLKHANSAEQKSHLFHPLALPKPIAVSHGFCLGRNKWHLTIHTLGMASKNMNARAGWEQTVQLVTVVLLALTLAITKRWGYFAYW